jgi:hypothetical protein
MPVIGLQGAPVLRFPEAMQRLEGARALSMLSDPGAHPTPRGPLGKLSGTPGEPWQGPSLYTDLRTF